MPAGIPDAAEPPVDEELFGYGCFRDRVRRRRAIVKAPTFHRDVQALIAADPGPAIRLRGVSKSYGDHCVLAPTDLEIFEGEFFCLLGPSGGGKTTLLNLLAGFVAPSAGSIEIQGEHVEHTPSHHRCVNTVFQTYALFPHMTVRENVAFGLKMAKVHKATAAERVEEALELVQLCALGERFPNELSGGQQQRVAVARALVNRPAVLLLDEPLGALDLKLRKTLQLELGLIHREVGGTFVYVTHDQEEAMSMADRIGILNEGRIEQIGDAEEIYTRPRTRFVASFIGESNLFHVDEAASGGGRLVLSNGTTIPRPNAEQRGDLLMVRPERLRLARPGGSEWGVPGEVVTTAFLGTHVRVVIRSPACEEHVLAAIYDGDQNTAGLLAPGSLVALSWDPAAGSLVASAGDPDADSTPRDAD